jgi:hypothetical protein
MNLLKVLMLVCLAASLSLLIPVTSRANDHPWDDNTPDSTSLQGSITPAKTDDGGIIKPFVDAPIIQRISGWVRGVFREVQQVFSGQDKQESKGAFVEKNKRPAAPVRHGDTNYR